MFLTAIAFIVIFSILVLIHEWGHFTAARRAGIKVEEFGLGLPPLAKNIYKDKKGTTYTLNWIPFGGFVRLYGEDSEDPKVLKDKKSFASKTIWQRTTVILAGVFMNFVLAWAIITIGFMVGMKPFLVTHEDVEKGIEAGLIETQDGIYVSKAPIEESAFLDGDMIINIEGIGYVESSELINVIKPNETYNLTVIRGDKEEVVIEVKTDQEGKFGIEISDQKIITNVNNITYPFYIAPIEAGKEVARLSVLTVKMFGNVIVSLVGKLTIPDGVAGPVGIAKMTHRFVQEGFMALMQFMALISISLGVINVMPFPALDGGRFLFIVFELITRRKPNAKWERIIHTTGFGLLMILIVVITWNDILGLFQ